MTTDQTRIDGPPWHADDETALACPCCGMHTKWMPDAEAEFVTKVMDHMRGHVQAAEIARDIAQSEAAANQDRAVRYCDERDIAERSLARLRSVAGEVYGNWKVMRQVGRYSPTMEQLGAALRPDEEVPDA